MTSRKDGKFLIIYVHVYTLYFNMFGTSASDHKFSHTMKRKISESHYILKILYRNTYQYFD